MQNTPVDASLGAGAAQGSGPVSAADVMALIYESGAAAGDDPFKLFDAQRFNQREWQRLEKLLDDKKENLTDAERSALRNQKHTELVALVKRLRVKELRHRAEVAVHEAHAQKRGADGLTNSKIPMPQGAASPDHLPHEPSQKAARPADGSALAKGGEQPAPRDGRAPDAKGPGKEAGKDGSPKALAKDDRTTSRPGQTAEGKQVPKHRALPVVQQPVTDPKRLAAIRQELLRLVTSGEPAKHEPKPAVPAKLAATMDAEAKQRATLGKTLPSLVYSRGFPAGGRSGQAAQNPVMQWAPPRLKAGLEAAGIQNLAELLTRCHEPAGRQLLAELCGVPRTTIFLMARRAEILDLPTDNRMQKQPHLKDVLLLSRLGFGSIREMAVLFKVFDRSPSRLEVAAKLVGLLQKADPDYVGRTRLTRHELREWARLAEKRGSDLVLPDESQTLAATSQTAGLHPEDVAEQVLAWYLEQRLPDGEAAWRELVVRLGAWLTARGAHIDEDTLHALWLECDETTRKSVETVLAARREALLDEEHRLLSRDEEAFKERLEAEHERQEELDYEAFVLREANWSLFLDLAPWLKPDPSRQDKKICFWLDPLPDHRQVRESAGDEQIPASLMPAYICLDPESGAIEPGY